MESRKLFSSDRSQNWNSGYDEIFEYRPISSKASFFNLTFEASIPSTYKEDEVLLHAL